jgi:hypothetical protein
MASCQARCFCARPLLRWPSHLHCARLRLCLCRGDESLRLTGNNASLSGDVSAERPMSRSGTAGREIGQKGDAPSDGDGARARALFTREDEIPTKWRVSRRANEQLRLGIRRRQAAKHIYSKFDCLLMFRWTLIGQLLCSHPRMTFGFPTIICGS